MAFFVVEQLAVPSPKFLAQHFPWLGSSAIDWLCDRVLELCYTSSELGPFADSLGYKLQPFRWRPDRRILLQAEIDAAVLHLYDLNRAQAECLLESFTVLRKYEEQDYREFRTKRVILDIYDGIAVARA